LGCFGGAAAVFVMLDWDVCEVIFGVGGLFKDSTSASSSEKESKEIPEDYENRLLSRKLFWFELICAT
jgi:hypothetical protein